MSMAETSSNLHHSAFNHPILLFLFNAFGLEFDLNTTTPSFGFSWHISTQPFIFKLSLSFYLRGFLIFSLIFFFMPIWKFVVWKEILTQIYSRNTFIFIPSTLFLFLLFIYTSLLFPLLAPSPCAPSLGLLDWSFLKKKKKIKLKVFL